MSTSETGRSASWTRYWSAGALHSCAGSFDGNYSGDAAEFWQAFADGLPHGARILDLAAGNGPVTRLLLDRRGGLCLEAVDLADVRPAWLADLAPRDAARVRFHPLTPAESLPFPDGSLQAVASQFGLEYTDWDGSLPELARVLAPGSGIALVLHDRASLVLTQAREELAHLVWIEACGLISAAEALCPLMARAATPAGRALLQEDSSAGHARGQINALLAEVAVRASASPCPDVLHQAGATILASLQACQHTGRADAGLPALADLRQALADSALRLEELGACALDEADVLGLVQRAGWREARISRLCFPGGERLGWGLRAQSPG